MTVDMPILDHTVAFDEGIFTKPIDTFLTLTYPKSQMVIALPFPTGTDLQIHIAFPVPQDYSGSPVLVIRGILNGTPANVLAFGVKQVGIDDSEGLDIAYETEDLSENSTWTGYADEDMYEETITLTPAAAYVAGDTVFLWFFRDNNVDDTTFDFLLTDLLFQYSDS